jgi:hypothetical protein
VLDSSASVAEDSAEFSEAAAVDDDGGSLGPNAGEEGSDGRAVELV